MTVTRHPKLSRIAPLALVTLLPLCAYSLPAHACPDDSSPCTPYSPTLSDGQSVPQDDGASDPQATTGRTVPETGVTLDPDHGTPPTLKTFSSEVGGEAASNTLSGTSAAAVLNLFSIRIVGIGKSSDDAQKEAQAASTPNNPVEPGSAYPTHAFEFNDSLLLGGALANKREMVEERFRARLFLGGTGLARLQRSCSYYLGAAAQLDGSFSSENGESQVIAGIGPEGGLMCQLGDVMLQLGGAASVGSTMVGMSSAFDKEIDTGQNAIAVGGRARLIVGNNLYISAQALQTPRISQDDWESQIADVSAQLRVGHWIFVGSLKHLKMHDDSGIAPDFKGDAGTLTAGHEW